MIHAIKRFTTWITITSLVALGVGGVVAQAEVVPQGDGGALPIFSLPAPMSTPENGDWIDFEASWSTAGLSSATTVEVTFASPATGVAPQLGADFQIPVFESTGTSTASIPKNSSGNLMVHLVLVNNQVLESDEDVIINIWKGTDQSVLLATTTVTIQDDDTYADGFKGTAPLSAVSAQGLMNAYELAIISNDIYATGPENQKEDHGLSEWQNRFKTRYLSADYGWSNVKTYNATDGVAIDTQAATMRNDSAFVIAFRGTQQMHPDALTDGYATTMRVPGSDPGVWVHNGFWQALAPVYSQIVSELKAKRGTRTVWITGHSLGGALAELMAYRIKSSTDPAVKAATVRVVTFGAPMVGQAQFNDPTRSTSFPARVGAANMQRWVNLQDPVPQVPALTVPGWVHNSPTTVMKTVGANTVVTPGAAMPDTGRTGLSFGDHSLTLYSNRLVEVNARKLGISQDQFRAMAPPLIEVPAVEQPDIEDPSFIGAIKSLGAGIGIGLVAIIGIVVGLTALVLAELFLLLDYAWNEIADALESAYHATAEEVATLISDLGASATEVASALKKVFGTTATEAARILEALGASIADVARALDKAFGMTKDAIASLLKSLGAAADEIVSAFKDAFAKLDFTSIAGFLESAGFAIGAIAKAIFNAFSITVQALAQALKDIGFAALEVAGALARGIASTAAAIGTALKNVFNATAEFAATILKTIGVLAEDIVSVLSTVFKATASVIASILKAAGELIGKIAKLLADVLGAALSVVADALSYAFGAVYNAIAGALKAAYSAVIATASAIANALKGIGAAMGDVANALKTAFSWAANKATELAIALKDAFGNLFSDIATAVRNALSATAGAVASAIKSIGAGINTVATAVKTAFSWAADRARDLASALKTAFGAMYDAIAGALKAVWNVTKEVAADALRWISASWDAVATALKNVYSAAAAAVASAMRAIGATWDNITSALKNVFSAGVNAVANALKSAGATFSAIATAIYNAFSAGWDMLYDLLVALGASISAVLDILLALF